MTTFSNYSQNARGSRLGNPGEGGGGESIRGGAKGVVT